MKREFILKGLDCASCASTIEEHLSKKDYIKKATVNFGSSKLSLIVNDDDNLIDKLRKDINIIEDGIDIVSIDNKDDVIEKRHYKSITMIIGFILFIGAILTNKSELVSFILYIGSYILMGYDIFIKAFNSSKRGRIFDENFLMFIATLGAFMIGEYDEAIAVVLLYNIGEFFETIAVTRSRKSIAALMDIRPEYAHLYKNNEIYTVNPEEIIIGDTIVVKPGEKIPLDGEIIDGVSSLDTSKLTGESKPVKVAIGSAALSGSINKTGLIKIKVTKNYENSTVSKILDLVENASEMKTKTENFITKFASIYTPIVVFVAILIVIVLPMFSDITIESSVHRALVFLVASCPCAIVISVPLSYFSAIGKASSMGILIKGSNYLEVINNLKVVIFDKTGTLTEGTFTVREVTIEKAFNKDEVLRLVAHAESSSHHPIATSIVEYYGGKIDHALINDIQELDGLGIDSLIDNRRLIIGNQKLMRKYNVEYPKLDDDDTSVLIAIDGKYAGYISIYDAIKKEAKSVIKTLKTLGIKTVMLTGDREEVANKIGKSVGIDMVLSELMPDSKVANFSNLKKNAFSSDSVAFVGDGINDVPVLSISDVGISMGGIGSDAAVEASDVVIMKDDLNKIVSAIKISKLTNKKTMQNIILALLVKAIVLLLGIFGDISMWLAVFADVGVTLITIINVLLILKKRI